MARPKTISVVPLAYSRTNPESDLTRIVRNPKFDDALIIFNDNFADRNHDDGGGNTAAIRPLAFDDDCRVVGVSTGWSSAEGGFRTLGDLEARAIALCFERINTILHFNTRLTRVVYSCNSSKHCELGFALFAPCRAVIDYITHRIRDVPNRFAIGLAVSPIALDMGEELIDAERNVRKSILNKNAYPSVHNGTGKRHAAQRAGTKRQLQCNAVTVPRINRFRFA